MRMCAWAAGRIRPWQTRKSPKGLEPPPGPCQRTTSRKTPGQRRDSSSWRAACRPAPRQTATLATRSRDRAPDPTEAHLSNSAIRSARFTAPILMALGTMNAWAVQRTGDYGSLSTALCLCVCAAGLFGEDLLQRGYRRDREVLAYVAGHPGAATRHVARAVGAPERVVARNLDRLADEGLLALVTGGASCTAVLPTGFLTGAKSSSKDRSASCWAIHSR